MIPQNFASALDALMHSGSVFGVFLTRGHDLIYQDTTFPESRISELVTILDDIAYYFEQAGRRPDQLSFGYDGGNILILLRDDLRLVLLHHQSDEIDHVAKASTAFLKDYGMSTLVGKWAVTKPVPA
jgi:hypothetical protein